MQLLDRLDSVKTRIREAITVLRHAQDDVKKCRGALKKGDSYCATGVLAKHWGWIPHDDGDLGFDEFGEKIPYCNNETVGYSIVDEKIGHDLVREIVNWNDNGKSFQQIAEKLEERLK